MRKLMMVVAAFVLAGGCGGGCRKKRSEEGTGGPPLPTGSDNAASGATTGSGSADVAGAKTPEGLAQRYEDCWAAWNANDWKKFGDCYTQGAVVESPGSGQPALGGRDAIVAQASKEQKAVTPDLHADVGLVMVHGSTVIGLVALHGHAAGNKPVGILFGTVVHFDDTGAQFDHEWAYMDALSLMRQLEPDAKHPARAPIEAPPMPHEVVLAKDDANEAAEVKTLDQLVAAFNKHDDRAWADVFTDDAVWSDQSDPADEDKKALLAGTKQAWQALSDSHLTATSTWAAGNYVATVGTLDGTNDHDIAGMPAKTGKKMSVPFLIVNEVVHGKVKATWLLDQAMAMYQQLGWTDLLPAAPAGAPPAKTAGSAAPK